MPDLWTSRIHKDENPGDDKKAKLAFSIFFIFGLIITLYFSLIK